MLAIVADSTPTLQEVVWVRIDIAIVVASIRVIIALTLPAVIGKVIVSDPVFFVVEQRFASLALNS